MKNFLFFSFIVILLSACGTPSVMSFYPDGKNGYVWSEGGYASNYKVFFITQVGADQYLSKTNYPEVVERVKKVKAVGTVILNDSIPCIAFKDDHNDPWEILTESGDTVVSSSINLQWLPEKITATDEEITLHGIGKKKWIEKSK